MQRKITLQIDVNLTHENNYSRVFAGIVRAVARLRKSAYITNSFEISTIDEETQCRN